ncbi:MAG: YceI family protein [Phycisphaerales bacterium JB050]
MNARFRAFHSIGVVLVSAGLVMAAASVQEASEPAENPQPTDGNAGGITFAPIADGGLGLEVSEALSQRGTVYHLLPGRATQATFTSETPIETFQGETDSIIGFAVIAPDEDLIATLSAEAPSERGCMLGAEFALPVESIRTGIDMRDRHLLSTQWLDAANHPHIRFRLAYLAHPIDATPENAPEGARTFKGELVGDMTIRGVTRPLRVPNTSIALLPESESTRRVAPGDLMALRCRYSLTLADFGIENPIIGRQVARTIQVDQVLYFSTIAPQPASSSTDSPSESSSPSEPSEAR